MFISAPIALFLSLGTAHAEEAADTSELSQDTAGADPEGSYAGGMSGCNAAPGAATALSLMGLALLRRQQPLRLVSRR